MAKDKEQRTEEPTPKRLKEARKRGQVPKSKDLCTSIQLVGLALGIIFLAKDGFSLLKKTLQDFLGRACAFKIDSAKYLLLDSIDILSKIIFPFLLILLGLALLSGFLQVGPLFTTHPLKLDIKRLDPITGFKRLLSWRSFFEGIKSMIKLLGCAFLAYITLTKDISQLLSTVRLDIEKSAPIIWALATKIFFKILILFLVIGMLDLLYQRIAHKKELRMTKEEVKKEQKETEGDPLYKSERKRVHNEILAYNIVEEVKNADCVIVNPIEIAVAIHYNEEEMNAPKVTAKGERKLAQKIVEIARYHGVPILRDIPLAHSLNELEVGEEIPEELYEAMAEILRFVYKESQRE